jgi:para-nitrobenzyl esterase
VLVATAQYRLGVLGFPAANLGLADQAAALAWLYDNVHAFGGNPHRITILGVEAYRAIMLNPGVTWLFLSF